MTTPTLASYLALSTRPTEAPTWIDVTDRVRQSTGLHISRGRTLPGEPNETGTATCALNNRDRRFDPTYQGTVANLVTNPSFESSAAGWLANSLSTLTRTNAQAYTGAYSLLVASGGGQGLARGCWDSQPISNQPYAFSCRVLNRDVPVGGDVIISIYWMGGANGPGWYDTLACTVSQATGAWKRISLSIAPDYPDRTLVNCYVTFGGVTANGQGFYLDAVVLKPGADDGLYSDGDQDNCRWSGTPHASTTIRGGPYFGQLKPMRRFKFTATLAGIEYPLFTGYVDGFTQQWPGGLDAIVPIRALDGFRVLALNDLIDVTYPAQLSSERINAILDATGWTTGGAWVLDSATNSQLGTTTILSPVHGDREVFAGDTTVQADTIEKTNALEYCQQIERAENGRLFVGADGAIKFHNRHYLYDPAQQTPRWTFSDASDPTGLPYADLETAYDDGDLYNTVACTRRNGTVQTATDATSKLDYFARALSETDLLSNSDSDMADRANWLLSRRKAPGYRVKALTIKPQSDDRLWDAVLNAELGDRITVQRTPQGIGDPWTADYQIEHIELTIQDGFWTVVWQLSPADTGAGVSDYDGTQTYWFVSNGSDEYAAYAVLGVTTTLGY